MIRSLHIGCLMACGQIVLISGCFSAHVAPPPAQLRVPVQTAPPSFAPPQTYRAPSGGPPPSDLQNVPEATPGEVFLPPLQTPSATYHEVRQGETLSGIASKYGVTVDQLLKANAWTQAPQLRPGDMILIPK